MSIFHDFPYTNFHEMNLDWIIKAIKTLDKEMDEFKVLNSISFAGEWTIEKAYAQWTLVDLNGYGYISIKPVPIGINIDNEDYWRLVANYSALYADFQNRVIALENSVERLENRYFIIISDSYGEVTGNWIEKFIAYSNIPANHVIGRGFSGQGFYVNGVNGFLNGLQTLESELPFDNTLVTDIIVCGGANDMAQSSYTTNLATEITNFLNYAKSHFTHAKVQVGFIGNCLFGTPIAGSSTFISYFDTLYFYSYFTLINGGVYLNGVEQTLHNFGLLSSDGLHPNDLGGTVLAANIRDAVFLGSASYKTGVDYLYITPSGCTINGQTGETTLGECVLEGESIIWKFPGCGITGPITISQSWTKIADITKLGYIYGNDELIFPIMVQALEEGSSSYYNYPMFLKISKGEVFLASNRISSGVFESHTYSALFLFAGTNVIKTLNN